MGKPTLSELAAMPYSEGQRAVRRYYDPKWGTEIPDGEPVKWQVTLRYQHSGFETDTFEITAATAEDAEKEAIERFNKGLIHIRGDKCEVDSVDVEARR